MINEINFELTTFCNMKCIYCFKPISYRLSTNIFSLYDELINFCRNIDLADQLLFKITGGEASLFCSDIEYAYKKLKKIERYKNTNISFGMTTNGTNMADIIYLLNSGILSPNDCKVSWDGFNSLRIPRYDSYDDNYFYNQLKILGKSKYNDKVRVRTAITESNVDRLSDYLMYLMDIGCRKWEYYFLDYYHLYSDRKFQDKFRKSLEEVMLIHNHIKFDFINYNNMNSLNKNIDYCKNFNSSLAIDSNGNVYPCLLHASNHTMDLGNIKSTDSKTIMDNFDRFNKRLDSIELFKIRDNMHCLKCKIYIEDKDILYHTEELRKIECEIFGVDINV